MTLTEISALPKGSFKIYDPTKERFEPLSWDNLIHFLVGSTHKAVRRYSAFNYGLCDGVPGQMPPTAQSGGFRAGCGRKPMRPEDKKVCVKVWLQKSTVDLLGGNAKVQKIILNNLRQRI
jgi:hypothetical protein